MVEETLVLFKNARQSGYFGTLEDYQKTGGYQTFQNTINKLKPEDVINQIKDSGLRGRGGAGFPTGLKWSFMAKGTGKPSYLIANADESEPGTCKDRQIMLHDPHLFLEGMMLGCYAIGCNHGYIYVRGEYYDVIKILNQAIADLHQAHLLGENLFGSHFNLTLTVHPGAGAYICGEETALLESLEGKRGLPKIKPPFPAVSGFNDSPTSVNNVETLTNVTVIMRDGVEAFKANGIENNAGTRIIAISGNVKNPGVYEVKMGTNLKGIIDNLAGGMLDGYEMKGVIPGGSSVPVLLPNEIDISYDYDSCMQAGTMMGSCGIIVLDHQVQIPQFVHKLVSFYNIESCGQCTPCREGVNWLKMILRDMLDGKGKQNTLQLLIRVCENINGNTLCALGDACAIPVKVFINKFRHEFENLILE